MNAIKTSNTHSRTKVSIVTAVFCLLAAGAATAESAKASFQMVAFSDLAHGRLITNGKFNEAIRRIETSRSTRYAFEKASNLCVAYTKAKALDKAAEACNDAVKARTGSAESDRFVYSAEANRRVRDEAIALSNRGVLRALTGDRDGARADFERSVELQDFLREPSANLEHLASFDVPQKATAHRAR